MLSGVLRSRGVNWQYVGAVNDRLEWVVRNQGATFVDLKCWIRDGDFGRDGLIWAETVQDNWVTSTPKFTELMANIGRRWTTDNMWRGASSRCGHQNDPEIWPFKNILSWFGSGGGRKIYQNRNDGYWREEEKKWVQVRIAHHGIDEQTWGQVSGITTGKLRSIYNKALEFWNLVDTFNPDIIIASESWLREDIGTSELFREQFTTFRRDRHTRGGGVFICIKNNTDGSELWVDDDFEITAVEVKGTDPKYTWEIVWIYRAPNEDRRVIERLATQTGFLGNSMKRFKLTKCGLERCRGSH